MNANTTTTVHHRTAFGGIPRLLRSHPSKRGEFPYALYPIPYTLIFAIIFTLTACDEKETKESVETRTEEILAFATQAEKAAQEANAANSSDMPQLVQTVEFNGKKIPMTVYYSDAIPNEFKTDGFDIDSLVFFYDGIKQTIRTKELESLFFNDIDNFNLIDVATDYNFDGYMDIAIKSVYSGMTNEIYEIFIYDPKIKNYFRHEELSSMMNTMVDNKTKTIREYNKGGHAGMLYSSKEYKWVNGKLTLISSEEQDYDGALDKYIHIVRILQNGKWVEQRGEVTDTEGVMVEKTIKASFDCAKVASPTEKAICSDADLARLDADMAKDYKCLSGLDSELKDSQKEWLKIRNKCGSNVECLKTSYKLRLSDYAESYSIEAKYKKCGYGQKGV